MENSNTNLATYGKENLIDCSFYSNRLNFDFRMFIRRKATSDPESVFGSKIRLDNDGPETALHTDFLPVQKQGFPRSQALYLFLQRKDKELTILDLENSIQLI